MKSRQLLLILVLATGLVLGIVLVDRSRFRAAQAGPAALDGPGDPETTAEALSPPPMDYFWQEEYVDELREFESLTNRGLTIDAEGNLHMAYGGTALTYARYDGSHWHREMIDEADSQYVAITLEPVPPYYPHISYHAEDSLKVAHRTAAGWVVETADSGFALILGTYTSIALEPTAPYTPHISYRDMSYGTLQHARRTATGWYTETVDTDDAFYTSIAIAPTAPYTVHVSYAAFFTPHVLRHAWWTPAVGWTIETVDDYTDAGTFSSIALDPEPPHAPRISYHGGFQRHPTYAWKVGSNWMFETIDTHEDAGPYTALALAPVAPYTPSVGYYAWNEIKLAERTSGGWTIESWPTDWTTQLVSLDLEPTAPYTPHLSYYVPGVGGNECIRDMVHAQRTAGGWASEVVDDGRNAGYAPSLALAPTAPYTAYATFGRLCAADPSDNGLVFARRTPEGRWISETVDNQGFVNTGWNKSTALAVEPVPPYTPHIAYNVYDIYPLIKYARLSGTTWISEVVAQNGTEVSFALEADPPYSPHITFLDTNGHLAHAWLSGTAWMVETAIGEWVDYYALDIASTAPFTPHVAYSPHDRIGLEHAWKAAGGWVTETVAYQYGSLFDLALEPAPPHTPHVSYGLTCFPGPDCGLLHAWWTSSGWLTETVQPGTGDWPVGWTSVIVETSPPYDPRFAYCWKDEKLNYAWWEGSSWEHTTLRTGNSCNSVDQSLEAGSPYPAHILYHDGGLIHVWQAPPHRLYLPVILRFY